MRTTSCISITLSLHAESYIHMLPSTRQLLRYGLFQQGQRAQCIALVLCVQLSLRLSVPSKCIILNVFVRAVFVMWYCDVVVIHFFNVSSNLTFSLCEYASVAHKGCSVGDAIFSTWSCLLDSTITCLCLILNLTKRASLRQFWNLTLIEERDYLESYAKHIPPIDALYIPKHYMYWSSAAYTEALYVYILKHYMYWSTVYTESLHNT